MFKEWVLKKGVETRIWIWKFGREVVMGFSVWVQAGLCCAVRTAWRWGLRSEVLGSRHRDSPWAFPLLVPSYLFVPILTPHFLSMGGDRDSAYFSFLFKVTTTDAILLLFLQAFIHMALVSSPQAVLPGCLRTEALSIATVPLLTTMEKLTKIKIAIGKKPKTKSWNKVLRALIPA